MYLLPLCSADFLLVWLPSNAENLMDFLSVKICATTGRGIHISFRVTKLCYYFPNELFILLHLDISSVYTNTLVCAFWYIDWSTNFSLATKRSVWIDFYLRVCLCVCVCVDCLILLEKLCSKFFVFFLGNPNNKKHIYTHANTAETQQSIKIEKLSEWNTPKEITKEKKKYHTTFDECNLFELVGFCLIFLSHAAMFVRVCELILCR